MFARAIFEAIEVKGGCMVKERDFEATKIKINVKNPTSNIGSISYDQFPARNGSNQQSLR